MLGRLSALLLAAWTVGCGGPDPESEIVVDTLAGGAIVVRNPDRGLWDEGEEWRLVEELRLGTATGAGPESFTDVRAVDEDAYGRIWIMDHQTNEIRVFDAGGDHVRTIGGTGGGPGEFRSLFGGGFDREWRLWAFDEGQNHRYTVFDTTGAVLATLPHAIWGYRYGWHIVFDENGRMYEESILPPKDGASEEGVLIFDPPSFDDGPTTLRTPDTFRFDEAAFEGRKPGYYRFETEGGFRSMPIPFTGRRHRVIDDVPTEWVGFGDEYRIVRRSLEGDTLLVVEKEHVPVHVAEEEVERFLVQMEEQNISRDLVDRSRIPDLHPAFEFFLVDDGRLWVARPEPADEPGVTFDVFDREGRLLGQVRSPAEIKAYSAWVVRDDRLYAVAFDELDVPYVVRLRIERGDD